jgi:hypothetical protein
MAANRPYSRVIAFDGGEVVRIPVQQDSPYIKMDDSYGTQVTVSLISAPW